MLFCFAEISIFVGFYWIKLSAKTRSFALALRNFCAPARAQHFDITLARARERERKVRSLVNLGNCTSGWPAQLL